MPRRKIDHGRSDLLLNHVELTEKQKRFAKIMMDPENKVIFLSGPAGSSKSFLSLYVALSLYNKDNELKIKYIRSIVESSQKSLGFLKGSLENKISPYLEPLKDKLEALLSKEEMYVLEKRRAIEGAPVNFLRGSDWKNLIAILDESQNCSFAEIKTILTRLNYNSKLILCGDFLQSDIKNSGFYEMCHLFDDEESKEKGVYHLHFTEEDIMRDPVVSFILKKIEKRNY